MKINLHKNNRYTLTFVLLMSISFESIAACYDYGENYGQVSRLYPQYNPVAGPGTFFQLKSGLTNALGGNSYYHIGTKNTSTGQSIYRSIHDLLADAAETGRTVYVRTSSCGWNSTGSVNVEYIVVDY